MLESLLMTMDDHLNYYYGVYACMQVCRKTNSTDRHFGKATFDSSSPGTLCSYLELQTANKSHRTPTILRRSSDHTKSLLLPFQRATCLDEPTKRPGITKQKARLFNLCDCLAQTRIWAHLIYTKSTVA